MIRTKVIGAMLLLLSVNAHALTMSFSFGEDGVADFGGTPVAGSVTGVISGLQDNLANQIAGITVEIFAYPAGLGGIINDGLIASNWGTIVGTGFSVFGGVLTGAEFAAQTTVGADAFDQIRLNYQSYNLLTFDAGATITGNSGGFSGAIYSTTVPEPASLALVGLGLAGLGFSRRKKA